MNIGILEPDHFSEIALQKLGHVGKVSLFQNNPDQFLADKEVLFIRLGHFIGKDFLDKCPKLKFICSPTTGFNHLDMDEVSRRGIRYISLKGETEFLNSIRATPEHTFGLILSLLRNYHRAFLHPQNARWDRDPLRGEELFGNTVGIIGLGRIGQRVASYCHAFDAKISYFDIREVSPRHSSWQKKSSLESLIESANIVLLCANYIEGKPAILAREHFLSMEGKYFINTARGELIDESSLLNLIAQNHFKGVALDVIDREIHADNRLNDFLSLTTKHNLLITPHIAGATFTSMRRTEEFIAEHLLKKLKKNEHAR